MEDRKNIYLARSDAWSERAIVRSNTQTYDLDLPTGGSTRFKKPAQQWHLPGYSAILSHRELEGLSEENKEFVRGLQLLEFVLKQAKFEVDCVNWVANRLALGKFEFVISERMKLDALKIYTDEGYHAYFTQKIANQILSHYGISQADLAPYLEGFFDKIELLVTRHGEENRALGMFALVVVAECQVVSDISEEMKQVVHEPIRAMFKDHMEDEIFHAKYFHSVFERVWPQLSSRQKEIVALSICEAMELLGTPRVAIYFYSLAMAGVSEDTIAACIADIYESREWKTTRIKERMYPTTRLLRSCGVFENPKLKQLFLDKEYI